MGSVAYLAERLEADLYGYLPELYKNPLSKLAVMVSAVIEARSCNLMEIAARLPIKTQRIRSLVTRGLSGFCRRTPSRPRCDGAFRG